MSSSPASTKMLGTTQVSRSWIVWEICVNVLLAAYFARFVYLNGYELYVGFRLSSLLILMKVSADTIFHLTRNVAKQITVSTYDWAIGICGGFTCFFYRSIEGHDHALGTVIQILGMAMQVYAMLSLNRSIGFVAANRGVKTQGMYKYVRHPLYCAYILAFFGFVLNHPSLWNISVYSMMVCFLLLRAMAEERLLLRSVEYQEYAKKVRWRLLPYVV